jgi:hypothetical protein
MKSTINSFHKMYNDLASIGWTMVLGHAPAQVRTLTPRAGKISAVHQWEDEGGSLIPPKDPKANPEIKRAPDNRHPPKIAPGKKRRSGGKAKSASRR